MRKNRILGLAAVIFLVAGAGLSMAAGQKGVLNITGVPEDVAAGRYDPEEGLFYADVSDLAEALIEVKFEEVRISGKEMEWRTKDNYLIFRQSARLEKDDFELTADLVEYFGDEKRLHARGGVVVTTEDATVYADQLAYDEKTDEALFTGGVKVVFDDGTLRGEKFLMVMEKSELRFFGAFQGEFEVDSN
ncbi:MAG TPA: hypothetical protein GX521_05380 [Firmicutes bacterium]|nr:hypothetical protein [Bacillota bacterium]